MISRHGHVLRGLLPAPYEASCPEVEVELEATGLVLDSLEERAGDVLAGTLPSGSDELLPLWEAAVGLPEAGTTVAETNDARAADVLAKMALREDFSMPYLLGIAAALGFPDTVIQRVTPTTCVDPCTLPVFQPIHRSYLDVRVPSAVQQPALERAFLRVQPADVIFRFFYEA